MLAGYVAKETSKLGPRPEKPIELYEFEGYLERQILFSYFDIVVVQTKQINLQMQILIL